LPLLAPRRQGLSLQDACGGLFLEKSPLAASCSGKTKDIQEFSISGCSQKHSNLFKAKNASSDIIFPTGK